MKKIFLFLVLSLSLFTTISLLIALCSGVTIFFANGMNNDRGTADKSLRALQNKLTPLLPEGLDVNFKLAYNHKEDAIPQVVEAGVQKGFDKWKSFWNYLSDLEPAPDWFQNAAKDIISVTDSLSYVVDSDLQKQVDAYREEIRQGRQVIVVAHSQGNFYANAAHSLVNSDLFSILAIATPADYVAGDGPHITLTDDFIINGIVRPLDSSTLSAEITNNTDNNSGWSGHDFDSSYLEGDVTGKWITDHVGDLIDQNASSGDSQNNGEDSAECESEEKKDDDLEEESENSNNGNNTAGDTIEPIGNPIPQQPVIQLSSVDIQMSFSCAFCDNVVASFASGSIDITNQYNFKQEVITISGVEPGTHALNVSLTQREGEVPTTDGSLSLSCSSISTTYECCYLSTSDADGKIISFKLGTSGGTANVHVSTTCPPWYTP